MRPRVHTELIAPIGLGYGEGAISVENIDDNACSEVAYLINSENIMTDAVSSTDGCPDGRECVRVINADEELIYNHRPKVFGGGATMIAAAQVGGGNAKGSLNDVFDSSLELLSGKGIGFGAHSSDKSTNEQSGCGAIDNALLIFKNSVKYRKQIRDTICSLIGNGAIFENNLPDVIDEVIDNNEEFVSSGHDGYQGKKVLDKIAKNGTPIKELTDDHKEAAIVINTDIAGQTVDQSKIRDKTGNNAQVFSLDLPRMRELADLAAETPEDKQKAFVSMLVYTLSTSATLTKGDLPVYLAYEKSPQIPLPA